MLAFLAAAGFCVLAAACGSSGGGEPLVDGGSPDPPDGGDPTAAPSNLSYPGGSLFLVVGEAMDLVQPSLEGMATSFSVAPALPQGLSLDPATGVIAGTPGERIPRKRHLVTAANAIGLTTAAVDIEVVGPARFAYVTNSGDSTLSIYAVEPGSGRLHFRGYHPHSTQESVPGPLAVHPDGIAAYVANQGSNSLSVHRLDPTQGRVASTEVIELGSGPHGLALLSSGEFLYLSSSTSGTISAYAVSSEDGSLSSVGTPLATGNAPSQILADPMGRFLVALDESAGSVSMYMLDSATGALAPGGSSSVGSGAMMGAALSPSGTAIYVTLQELDRIVHIAVDPDSGTLEQLGALPTAGDPAPPTIDPRGRHVYVPDLVAGSLAQYLVDPETGELTPQGSTTASIGASRIRFDSLGEFAYSVNAENNVLMVFRYDPESGELAEIESRRTRQVPQDLVFSAADEPLDLKARHMYVANRASDNLFSFVLDPETGLLGEPTVTPAGDGPVAIALDPLDRFAFAASAETPELRAYAVQADGSLNPLASPLALDGVPTSLAVDPSGRWVFVTDVTSNRLFQFEIAPSAGGSVLEFLDSRPVGDHPHAVRADPTGQFLYVVNRDGGGSLTQFGIDARSGALSVILPEAATNARPTSIAFSPAGHRAYSTLSSGHLVVPYNVNASQGSLQFVPPGTRAANTPFDVEISVSGRFCYTVMYEPSGTAGLVIFDVRAADGALWNSGTGGLEPTGYALTGAQPIDVASTPDERFIYVLNEGSSTLTALSIDATDGQLTFLQSQATGTLPSSIALAVRIE